MLEVFTQWNFVADFIRLKLNFIPKKTKKSLFEPHFRRLRGNVCTPSTARWKVHGQLEYITELFSLSPTVEMLWVKICRSRRFLKGVGHYKAKFYIEGLLFAPTSIDCHIGEWPYYKFAAGSFHTKKLCSRLYSNEVDFHSKKTKKIAFWTNLSDLGVTYALHLLVAKPLVYFICVIIELFSLPHTVETLWVEIGRSRRFSKGVGHFERTFQRERGIAHQPSLVSEN